MVKCTDCGFEDCELAYTGESGLEQCCYCFMKELNPNVITHMCNKCKKCEDRKIEV